MNKHLLETRLRSIAHYQSELLRIAAAEKATKSTLNDIVESCMEYFPFKDGDIIMKGESLYKVKIDAERKLSVFTRNGSITFSVWLLQPDYRNYKQQWQSVSSSPDTINLCDLDKYKVIS